MLGFKSFSESPFSDISDAEEAASIQTLIEILQNPTGHFPIELFTFDFSYAVGWDAGAGFDPILQVCNLEQQVNFDGDSFLPTPIEFVPDKIEGNYVPSPKLFLSGRYEDFKDRLVAFGNIEETLISRIVTFETFLDGQPNANPNATLDDEFWYIQRVNDEDKNNFELILEPAPGLDRLLGSRALPPIGRRLFHVD